MAAWPAPIVTVRGFLPAELRVVRGGLGFVGGAALVFGTLVQLLGGNWQLGFRHDWVLTAIFTGFIPGAVGVLSPLWYWLGRPIWCRFDRPGGDLVGRWRDARFLPGLSGALLGLVLLFPVSATSRFPQQLLFPLGLLVGITAPLWFWVGRPVGGDRLSRVPGIGRWFERDTGASPVVALGRRTLPAVGILLLVSAAVTAAIALPIAPMGDPVTQNGLAVTVSEARSVSAITRSGGETVIAGHARGFLLVHLAVSNGADRARPLPGAGPGDVAVIAPACQANTFGEPSHNCNQVYLDGPFTAGGVEYRSYAAAHETAAGRIGPGETVSGWLAVRIEGASPARGFEPMVIVDDVGRWTLGDDGMA